MKKSLISIAVLVVLGGLIIVGLSTMNTSVNPGGSTGIATSTIQEVTPDYAIDIAYPRFGIPAIDVQVQSIVDKAVTDFKAIPPNPPDSAAGPNELDGEYHNAYLGYDIVSAKLLIYQYTGGAHGNTVAFGLNFDPATGKVVTLDDALLMIGKTLPQVSDTAVAQLTAQFDMVQFPEGATPTPENYATFYIDKDSVTFVFQQYQVEAYAAGMPEVSFPRVK